MRYLKQRYKKRITQILKIIATPNIAEHLILNSKKSLPNSKRAHIPRKSVGIKYFQIFQFIVDSFISFTNIICYFLQSYKGIPYFCIVFRDKIEIKKRKCLISCEIANINKEYTRYGAVHIQWAAYPCVYSGVWRYLQECMGGSPLSITNNIVKLSYRLPAENSCKIRHYEQCNYVDKHSHAVLLCLLWIFACTEKKPQAVAMVLKLLAKWSYCAYRACLFPYFRV